MCDMWDRFLLDCSRDWGKIKAVALIPQCSACVLCKLNKVHDNNLVCLKLDHFWQVAAHRHFCSSPHFSSASACLVWFAHGCRHDKRWESSPSVASRQNPCLLRASGLCVTSQTLSPRHQDMKEPKSPFSTGSKMEKWVHDITHKASHTRLCLICFTFLYSGSFGWKQKLTC